MFYAQTTADPENESRLRYYLTDPLWAHWQGGDTAPGLQHLQAVMRAVLTYLPRRIAWARLTDLAAPAVSGVFAQVTLLFADIAGFTAMSERLTQLGREGAEVITSVVNDCFAAMLEIIARHGGDLFKFGGDALLVCFGGDDGAVRGCRAALEMQQVMDRFTVIETTQGTFSLRMTAALGTGTLFLIDLGSSDRLEFAVMGPTLEQMARAEDLAEVGEVVIDRITRDAADTAIAAVERSPGFYRLTAMTADAVHPPDSTRPPVSFPVHARPAVWQSDYPSDERWLVTRLDALTPYLPPGILERIVASPERVMIEGEHRLATVLFANFYGINEILVALGPDRADEITTILNRHFVAMREVISRYGGIVNKVDTYAIGYRIMAVYGAPTAHEDDPARAVRAALEMQETMKAFADLATSAGHFSLKQRIGINTGYVFAGNLGSALRQEYSVMGDEVNLASRLMGVAAEGQVLISRSTARHVEGLFELEERDPVKVKGKSQPVLNYQVGSSVVDRRERATTRGKLFGRQRELETAQALVDRVLTGRGAVLDVSGSRGIGKTRLVQELIAYASEHGMAVLRGAALSYGHSIPYLPWIAILRSLLKFKERSETPQHRRNKLVAALEEMGASDWAPIVGRTLGIEIEENRLTASLDPEMRQQRFFDVVLQLIQEEARHSPLLLALDDMHWADAVSLDLAAYVARNAPDSPLLFVIVHWPDEDSPHPEETLPWRTGPDCHTLYLSEIEDRASLELARSVLRGPDMPRLADSLHPANLSPPLRSLLLERTQGTPLFVEEVARALSESGGIRLGVGEDDERTWIIVDEACCAEVPTTLSGLIMSRIDRLEATNRRLLQVSSVIGVDFRPPVLARVYPYQDLDGTLDSRLAKLTQLDLLLFSPPEEYAFKHTLTHEVAYESLPFARRRELHVRVGEDIERRFAGDLAEQYGVLAHHFDRGHAFDKAFVYLVGAGGRARDQFANQAALGYYERALDIAAEQDAPPLEVQSQALDALAAMGDVYLLIGRYAQAIDRFRTAIAHDMCTPRRTSDLLRKIAKAHELRGQYGEALQYLDGGRWVLSWEEQDKRSVEMARICDLSGQVHMRRGEVEQAIAECEQGLAILTGLARDAAVLSIEAELYNTLAIIHADLQANYSEAIRACQRSTDLRQQAGDLPGLASCHNNLARFAWIQGDLAGAGDYLQRSLEISRQTGDNNALAFVYNNLGVVSYWTGDVGQALDHYYAALSLRQRIGDNYGVAQTCYNIGEALLSLERYDEARRYLERSATAFEAIQSERELPEVYCLLAEAELARDDVPSALDYAGRARRIAKTIGNSELQGIAERFLARGRAQAGDVARAKRSFEASIELLHASGHQMELSRSHYWFGLWLARQAGQEKQARGHLQQAASLFAAAGAEKEVVQARSALDQLDT